METQPSENYPWEGREILLATLSELRLPVRLQNALRSQGCRLVGQLVQLKAAELLAHRELGWKTFQDAKRTLEEFSLGFGMSLPGWNDNAAREARANLDMDFSSETLRRFATPSTEKRGINILYATLDEAGLPQRIVNCLPTLGCTLVGHLVQKTEAELHRIPNLGAGSIGGAAAILKRHGLRFGMTLSDWTEDQAQCQRTTLVRLSEQEREETRETVPDDLPREVLYATLAELGLPQRFLNQLPAQGCRLIGQLIQRKESDLLRLPNLGRKSIAEAKEILKRYSLSFDMKVPDWPQGALARRNELIDQIPKVLFKFKYPEVAEALTLEEEAISVFEDLEQGRNVEMLCALLGFDGRPPKTLEAVGQKYGLTRERVRQIEERASNRFRHKWRPTPRLDEAISSISSLGATRSSEASSLLRERGITSDPVHPLAVIDFARFVGKETSFRRHLVGDDEFYSDSGGATLVKRCALELRRATSSIGCTSVERMAVALNVGLDNVDHVRKILKLLSETKWLGPNYDWAISTRPVRNRVINLAEKVFSVTESITLPELRRCISRCSRLPAVPAPDALTDLLAFAGVATRTGDTVVRNRVSAPDSLSSIEQAFLSAFEVCGSPAAREELEEVCVDRHGVHPTSFWIYLGNSPILLRLAPGVFSLAGANVPVGSVEQLQRSQPSKAVNSEFGWTPEGDLWCVFELDRLAIHAGRKQIPAFVSKLVGGVWKCVAAGELPAGEITVDGTLAKGLGESLRLAGAEHGDLARLTFNLSNRLVKVRVGSDELFDATFEEGGDDEFDQAESQSNDD